jgi:hypothetical protein
MKTLLTVLLAAMIGLSGTAHAQQPYGQPAPQSAPYGQPAPYGQQAIGQSAIAFCRCAAFSYLQPNSSLLRAGLLVWLPPKQLSERLPATAVGVHVDGNLDKCQRAKIFETKAIIP